MEGTKIEGQKEESQSTYYSTFLPPRLRVSNRYTPLLKVTGPVRQVAFFNRYNSQDSSNNPQLLPLEVCSCY